jgi:large subunit ribosomal protein L25
MATATEKHHSTPIVAELRTTRGSRKSQEIRANGRIPAIVYGHGEAPLSISVPAPHTTAVIHSGAHVADVVIEGKAQKVLIQDVQYDYLQKEIEHIDLMRIDANQRVKVKVPLDFRGTPKGTKEGGILEKQFTELEVEVLALAIPDLIRVNVEGLELNGIIHAKDIALPEGAKLLNYPDQIICQVRTVKEVVAAEGEVAVAEPEVIGKKKEEEGAEGEAGKAGDKAAKPAGGAAKK